MKKTKRNRNSACNTIRNKFFSSISKFDKIVPVYKTIVIIDNFIMKDKDTIT